MHRSHQSICMPDSSLTSVRRTTRPQRSHLSVTTCRAIVIIIPQYPVSISSLGRECNNLSPLSESGPHFNIEQIKRSFKS